MSRKTRYFKIIGENGRSYGRFTGSSPKQAASKAFTAITKKKKNKNAETNFTIRECTRGSHCKKYHYIGKRVELETPKIITIGSKEVKYKYANKIARNKNVAESSEEESSEEESSEEETSGNSEEESEEESD